MEIEKFLDDYIAPALPAALDTISMACLEGVVGAVVPRVGNVMLAYQQRQQEKRFEQAINEIKKRQDEINEIIKDFEDDMKPKIGRLLDIYLEYSAKNIQEEKIELLANGYVNSIKVKKIQEDILFGFYDMLSQLNLLDIRVLRTYMKFTKLEIGDTDSQIIKDYNIDVSQYEMIKMKLLRLGLLENVSDIRRDQNVINIVNYLQAVNKNKPKDAQRSLGKIREIMYSDEYTISSYGRRFICFFVEKNPNIQLVEDLKNIIRITFNKELIWNKEEFISDIESIFFNYNISKDNVRFFEKRIEIYWYGDERRLDKICSDLKYIMKKHQFLNYQIEKGTVVK